MRKMDLNRFAAYKFKEYTFKIGNDLYAENKSIFRIFLNIFSFERAGYVSDWDSLLSSFNNKSREVNLK